MEKIISKEMEVMGMKERIWQIREDLSGNVLLSAKLVKAAFEKNWEEVDRLLNEGADPRICRHADGYGVESALYFALADNKWNIAAKLYDAGDRLDDLISEVELPLPWQILDFLAHEMRCGKNYFLDESKTLSECCRCSAFEQIEKLMPSADKEELNKAFVNTVSSWIRYFNHFDVYGKILNDLLERGAKISDAEKTELLESIDRRFNHRCPAVMYPGKETVEQVIELIKKA